MNTSKQAQHGFTLIEMMIVVAIIGILAAIAIPSYQDYVRKSRRTDATVLLSSIQQAQEKYRANNVSYATTVASLGLTGNCGTGNLGIKSENSYYCVTLSTTATGTTYSATATAQGAQTSDKTACKTLILKITNGNAAIYDSDGTSQTCTSK